MEFEQLVTYIRQQFASGLPKEVIVLNLKKNGWSENDIEQAFLKLNSVYLKNSAIPATALKSPRPKLPVGSIVFALFLCGVAAAGIYYQPVYYPYVKDTYTLLTNKKSLAPTSSIHENLLISYVPIPPETNSAAIFAKLTGPLIKTDEIFLKSYIENFNASRTPPVAQSKLVLARNKKALDVFNESVPLSHFQCSTIMGEKCNYTSSHQAAQLALLQAYVLLKEENYTEAYKRIDDVLLHGKKLTRDADNATSLTTGWSLQKSAYEMLVYANTLTGEDKFIPNTEITLRTEALRNEHKNLERYTYTRGVEVINYITNAENSPRNQKLDSALEKAVAHYREVINPPTWAPEETIGYLAQSTIIKLENIDLPCDKASQAPILHLTVDDTVSPSTQKNYYGKKLYANLVSEDDLNTKRCEVEASLLKLLEN